MLIDNKKTREISWNDFELEGNKENLIKQGWESFEPYENKLNLIPNGWESFVPYGGANVKITPLGGGLNRVQTWGGNNRLKLRYINSPYENDPRSFSTYIKTKGVVRFLFGDNVDKSYSNETYIDEKYIHNNSNEVRVFAKDVDDDLDFIATDPQIVEGDSPNMAYSIQELDNDLYRIRTWGGDHDMKFKSPNFGQLAETGTDMTISLYVENNSDSMIRLSNNLAIGGEPYPDGVEYMITVPREYKGFAYLKGEKVDGTVELDIRSDGNIDMIVSQPEIIEGHDLNAMLLIEDLDDGRKHVQVHNVNENTKLVYTGGGVIKGEPYTLETEIENDGRIFNLSANMFDDKVEVQKGMNDIRKSGELQDKELKIEIGVD